MNLRNLAIWGVIAMVLLAVYGVTNQAGGANPMGAQQKRPAEISYTELLRRVEAGEVQSVTINGDKLASARSRPIPTTRWKSASRPPRSR